MIIDSSSTAAVDSSVVARVQEAIAETTTSLPLVQRAAVLRAIEKFRDLKARGLVKPQKCVVTTKDEMRRLQNKKKS